MRWLRVREGCDEACVEVVVRTWESGGLVVYPTDTVYGLGADAENESAVLRVYEVKGREGNKPLTIAVSDLNMAERYAILDEVSRSLMRKFLPGKVTFILPKTDRVLDAVNPRAIGIRIPNLPLTLKLIRAFGRAVTATSANKSGFPPKRDPRDVVSEIEVDLVLDYGILPPSRPSTVVDLTAGRPVLVREGDVPFQFILEEFRRIVRS